MNKQRTKCLANAEAITQLAQPMQCYERCPGRYLNRTAQSGSR
jgi:hypothetical protein